MIIKGIIIGIGKIIPGLSGSVIAISLGVYEKCINILNNFFRSSKEDLIYLLKLSIGIFISILFLTRIILKLLNINYTVIILLFSGFILGSLMDIKKDINKKHNIIIYISLLISTLLNIVIINKFNIKGNIIYLILGLLESITMIIPGISGSAIYTNLGIYNKYLKFISNITIFKFNILELLLFVLGLIIGGIITIKLVNYLFKNNKSLMYSIIYGFSLSNVILMVSKALNTSNYINILLGLIFFILGFKIIKKSIFMIDYKK